jgi:hypothetical protein
MPRPKSTYFFVLLLLCVQGCSAKKPEMFMYIDKADPMPTLGTGKITSPIKAVHPELSADPAFAPWLKYHDAILKTHWAKPFNSAVSCTVTVDKQGNLTEVKLWRTSGSAADDAEAIALVKDSGPFRPLPVGFEQAAFLVRFAGFPNVFIERVKSAN